MQFMDNPPHFIFFTGKGGVGKTSIACASAVRFADAGKKTLLVSTDPASNVGQVFGAKIGNKITPIPDVSNLSALEIDPQAAAQAYRDRIVGPVRGTLPESVVKGIEEQLSGACTTEIAAFDEFTALLIDQDITAKFDHIIFDTAPTGHTIRLLQLPGAWSGFLEASKGDASCLGPLAGLEKQKSQYKAAVEALRDPSKTRLVLVARAQSSTLREAARTHAELKDIGIGQQYLVINGVLPKREAQQEALSNAVFKREQAALANMPEAIVDLPRDTISLKPFNFVGLAALRDLEIEFNLQAQEQTDKEFTNPEYPSLSKLVDEIEADGHGLIMLMGKGGVGKTTIAATVAVELAGRGHQVHLTTSDPAAHLTETLHGSMPNLCVDRIDPHAETERYRAEILAAKGKDLDAEGRALLEEDLRSPCTEEIAVFQAFSRIIKEAGKKFVVMDTAPTGHTLLLLDATGAYHREVARMLDPKGAHYTTPMMQLQDSKQTKVLLVTLAETTPVLEAANLQEDLRRAEIEPWAWVVNNSILAAKPKSSFLIIRAKHERDEIDAVTIRYARRYAVVPLMANEPVGVELLRDLAAPLKK